jgi:hypothetical protein
MFRYYLLSRPGPCATATAVGVRCAQIHRNDAGEARGTIPSGQDELMPTTFGPRFFPSLRVPNLLYDADEVPPAPYAGGETQNDRLQERSVIWSWKGKLR